ncbi:MAG: 1-acyl-sn-glycerol-3-phosphate acyltransferase [Alphaproteobacteria bacterium]
MSSQDDSGKPWAFPLDTDPETLEPLDGINRFPDEISIKPGFRPFRFIGVLGMRAMGWRALGTLPERPKFVAILMPHTSNVDFIIAVWIFLLFRVDMRYMIKADVFKFGFGRFLRWTGAIPIVRTKSHGHVDAAIEAFKNAGDRVILAIAPEGTRSPTPTLKKGFYHIAHGADVPIYLVTMHYDKRIVQFGPMIRSDRPWEEVEADIETFAGSVQGRTRGYLDRVENGWIHRRKDRKS